MLAVGLLNQCPALVTAHSNSDSHFAGTFFVLLKPSSGIADPRPIYTASLIHRHGREKG